MVGQIPDRLVVDVGHLIVGEGPQRFKRVAERGKIAALIRIGRSRGRITPPPGASSLSHPGTLYRWHGIDGSRSVVTTVGSSGQAGGDFDAVLVGGGHNGLVCAAYLARAGMSVCVVEARSTVGGCAASEHVVGATVNICNCDHSLIRTTPIIDDLELGRHGLSYVELDPGQVGLGWDTPQAGPVPFFRQPELTLEALSYTVPEEVDNYRRYLGDALPVARLVLEAASEVPTRTGAARRSLAAPGAAARLLAWSRRSVRDVLSHYFNSDAILGPAMAGGPAVWGLASTTPGTGLGALAPAFKHVAPVGRPVGGSGALTDALADAVVEAGGTILTGTRVTDIWCEGPAVRGVGIDDGGRTLTAPVVVVASNPAAAIVRYLRRPPPQASAFVDRWRSRGSGRGYEAKVDARISALPRWRHDGYSTLTEHVGWTDHLSPSTLVAPSLDGIDAAHGLMADGRVAERPMLFINVPSILDPSVAPTDQHVLSIEVLFTPYDLSGGWDGSTEPERWLEVASTLFEPALETVVDEWRAVTPVDYERHFSMPAGYADSFAGGPLAVVMADGHPELTRYETPIGGLYLTGAATFPGAGVWGAPGRNAARVILESRS